MVGDKAGKGRWARRSRYKHLWTAQGRPTEDIVYFVMLTMAQLAARMEIGMPSREKIWDTHSLTRVTSISYYRAAATHQQYSVRGQVMATNKHTSNSPGMMRAFTPWLSNPSCARTYWS